MTNKQEGNSIMSNDEQKELLKKFDKNYNYNGSSSKEGFFDKFKKK